MKKPKTDHLFLLASQDSIIAPLEVPSDQRFLEIPGCLHGKKAELEVEFENCNSQTDQVQLMAALQNLITVENEEGIVIALTR